MPNIHIPTCTALVSTRKCEHAVTLSPIVPREHDVIAFTMCSIPDGLEAVRFRVYDDTLVRFDVAELNVGTPIPVHVRTSMCWGGGIDIVFAYSKEHIESHGAVDRVVKKNVEYSDTEEEYLDTRDEIIRLGRRVHYSYCDMGHQHSATVTVPQVTLDVVHVGREAPEFVEESFWQDVVITRGMYTAKRLREFAVLYGMHASDRTPLDVVLQDGDAYDSFNATVRNTMVYNRKNGRAGLRCCF